MSISFSPDTSKGLGEIRLSCVYERAGDGSPPGGDKADLHYPQELGILHVNVVEARGLPKMDRFSHTDSFAKVHRLANASAPTWLTYVPATDTYCK